MEQLIQQIEADGNFKVLRKLQAVKAFHDDPTVPKKIGVIVDVETTGLDYAQENIIELGLIVIEFSKDGRIFKILHEFNHFEDPGKPIPQEITDLTGITDDHVAGQRIKDSDVDALVQDAVLIIAHNAGFDRPFVERRFPTFKDKYWACSQTQIPWKKAGISGSKLEYIAMVYKFFYSAHRAIDDCWAVLQILSEMLPKIGTPVMKILLEKARETSYLIEAIGAPFEAKDLLKARHYRWDGGSKVWSKEISESDLESEEQFLALNVYKGKGKHLKNVVNAKTRFSIR